MKNQEIIQLLKENKNVHFPIYYDAEMVIKIIFDDIDLMNVHKNLGMTRTQFTKFIKNAFPSRPTDMFLGEYITELKLYINQKTRDTE